jgi:hypothetical protein
MAHSKGKLFNSTDNRSPGGEKVIEVVRCEEPATYLKIVTSLVPRVLTIKAVSELDNDKIDAMIERLETNCLSNTRSTRS